MPYSVEETIKEVEEHGTDILLSTISPIDKAVRLILLGSRLLARDLLHLPSITAAPDDESESEENNVGDLGTDAARQPLIVEGIADHESPNDLREPVEKAVERAGADVEVGGV